MERSELGLWVVFLAIISWLPAWLAGWLVGASNYPISAAAFAANYCSSGSQGKPHLMQKLQNEYSYLCSSSSDGCHGRACHNRRRSLLQMKAGSFSLFCILLQVVREICMQLQRPLCFFRRFSVLFVWFVYLFWLSLDMNTCSRWEADTASALCIALQSALNNEICA